jgi:hypothetical protein
MNGKQAIALAVTVILALGVFLFYGQKIEALQHQKDVARDVSSIEEIGRQYYVDSEGELNRYNGPTKFEVQSYMDSAQKERIYLSGGIILLGLVVTYALKTSQKRKDEE